MVVLDLSTMYVLGCDSADPDILPRPYSLLFRCLRRILAGLYPSLVGLCVEWSQQRDWWTVCGELSNSSVGVRALTIQYIMLHAIFPSIATMPNLLPKSAGIDSANLICFFLFWGMTAAALAVPVRKWPVLINIKLVTYFVSCIGMLAMALVASKGVGDTLTRRGPAAGSERVWLIVRFTLLATASCATFVSNAADWQRNATKPRDPIFGQIFGFPMSNVSAVGPVMVLTIVHHHSHGHDHCSIISTRHCGRKTPLEPIDIPRPHPFPEL
jgi:hypothetical protein